jgi:toxin ParE1/3/4
MPRVVLAPQARRWVRAEVAYLAEISPAAVRRVRERIETAAQLLSEHPRLGVPGIVPDTRRLVVPPYVLIYRLNAGTIEVLDIRQHRQKERPIPEEG